MHGVAFARAEASWEVAARLRAAPPALAPESVAGPAGRLEALLGRRSIFRALIAASLIASIATVAVEKATAIDRYRTVVGERRIVRLADGTRIHLNTASAIEVTLKTGTRFVRLLQGEALFDVAHDASRPFLVDARGARFRVLGTAFDIRIRQQLVELTVTRGAVGVYDAGTAPHRIEAGRGAAIRAGVIAPTGLDPAEVQQRTAWQDGVIELDGDTLPQAIEEFNRYRTRPLVIGDPRLESLRVGGRFATHDSAMFVAALEASFNVRAVSGPDRSILLVEAD